MERRKRKVAGNKMFLSIRGESTVRLSGDCCGEYEVVMISGDMRGGW